MAFGSAVLVVAVACLASCGGSKPKPHQDAVPASRIEGSGSIEPQAAVVASASLETDRPARCAAFADRIIECFRGEAIRSDSEASRVREIAYAVCTKTTDDKAALHYYGNVDRTMACMEGKGCLDVAVCVTKDYPEDAAQ